PAWPARGAARRRSSRDRPAAGPGRRTSIAIIHGFRLPRSRQSAAMAPVLVEVLAEKEAEIHGVSHGGIAGVVRMEVIAAVEVGPEARRIRRIAHGRIEVDDAIECPAGANPRIDRLSLGLTGRVLVAGADERQERAAEDGDTLCMGAADDLLVAGDDCL